MRKTLKAILRFCLGLMVCPYVWADGLGSAPIQRNPFEISVAGGVNWIQSVRSPNIVISNFESDLVRVLNTPATGVGKIGVAYHVRPDRFQQPFFKALLLEANVYYTQASLNGDVWQFHLPQFNNYAFKAPFTSTRLMVDAKPHFFQYHDYYMYATFGIGAAWTNLGYYEQVTGAGIAPTSNLLLKRSVSTNVAYDLGLGVRRSLFNRCDIFLEYLYTYFGNVSPSRVQSQNNVRLGTPPAFKLNSQGILLGINWTV